MLSAICVHAYKWRKWHPKEAIVFEWVVTSILWDFEVVKKPMGSCTAQYNMLLFWAKTIMIDSRNFELAHLKEKVRQHILNHPELVWNYPTLKSTVVKWFKKIQCGWTHLKLFRCLLPFAVQLQWFKWVQKHWTIPNLCKFPCSLAPSVVQWLEQVRYQTSSNHCTTAWGTLWP